MKKQIQRAALLLTVLLHVFGSVLIAQNNEQELTALILKKDSLFWHAYNSYEISKMTSFLSENVEFLHDKGGITIGRLNLINSLKKSLLDNIDHFRIRREPIDSSIKIFPLKNAGVIYGAVCSGEQIFYIHEKGKSERPDGITRFFHVWLLNNGVWEMARIISYDHRPAPAKAVHSPQ